MASLRLPGVGSGGVGQRTPTPLPNGEFWIRSWQLKLAAMKLTSSADGRWMQSKHGTRIWIADADVWYIFLSVKPKMTLTYWPSRSCCSLQGHCGWEVCVWWKERGVRALRERASPAHCLVDPRRNEAAGARGGDVPSQPRGGPPHQPTQPRLPLYLLRYNRHVLFTIETGHLADFCCQALL